MSAVLETMFSSLCETRLRSESIEADNFRRRRRVCLREFHTGTLFVDGNDGFPVLVAENFGFGIKRTRKVDAHAVERHVVAVHEKHGQTFSVENKGRAVPANFQITQIDERKHDLLRRLLVVIGNPKRHVERVFGVEVIRAFFENDFGFSAKASRAAFSAFRTPRFGLFDIRRKPEIFPSSVSKVRCRAFPRPRRSNSISNPPSWRGRRCSFFPRERADKVFPRQTGL